MLKSAAIPHFANATILPNKFCGGKLFSRNLRISYGNYTPVHVNQALCLSHGPGKHDQVIPWYFRSATFPLPPMPASSGSPGEPARREKLARQGFIPDEAVHCVCRSLRRRLFLFRVRGRLILLPRKLAGEIFAEIQR